MPLLYSTKPTTSVCASRNNFHPKARVAHTRVDNVCIESLSIDLTRPMLDSAARSVVRLGDKIEE